MWGFELRNNLQINLKEKDRLKNTNFWMTANLKAENNFPCFFPPSSQAVYWDIKFKKSKCIYSKITAAAVSEEGRGFNNIYGLWMQQFEQQTLSHKAQTVICSVFCYGLLKACPKSGEAGKKGINLIWSLLFLKILSPPAVNWYGQILQLS